MRNGSTISAGVSGRSPGLKAWRGMGPGTDISVIPHRPATIDRGRGALNVACLLRTEEQRQRSHVLDLADPACAALGQCRSPQLLYRLARRSRALRQQLLLALGCRIAGMDHVDIHAIAHAELGQSLGEVRDRRVDRAADQTLWL